MNLKNKNVRYLAYSGVLLTVLVLFLIGLLTKLKYNCFHATDFSIYQEAIYKIAAFGDLNPYINMRDIKIFNDHFDPIILIASLYIKVFGYHAPNLIIFEYLFFVGIFVVIWNLKHLSTKHKLVLSTMTLFTKGILSGLNFPIHPTTWSMLPAFMLPLVLKRNKAIEIIGLSFLICLFKESFPFAIFTLSVFYFLRKEYKLSIPLLVISLSFLIFNFYFRKVLFGPTLGYGARLLTDSLANPIQVFTQFDFKSFFKVYYPFLIPITLIARRHMSIKRLLASSAFTGTVFFIVPLLAIQFLANQIHHQYGAQLTAPLLGIMATFPFFLQLNKKMTIFMVLLFLGSGIGSHTKNIRAAIAPKNRFCSIGPEKKSALKELKSKTENIASEEKILATGGIIPMLLKPEQNWYQAGYFSPRYKQYDFLILERNGHGKTMPLTREFIEKIIPKCRESATEVIIDNDIFFMTKGSSEACFKPILSKWIGARGEPQ